MPISSSVSAAVAGVRAALAAAGPLQGASPFALAPVQAALAAALAVFDSEAARLEGLIDQTSVGGVTAGGAGPVLVAAFQAQMAPLRQLAALKSARGYLARMLVNLNNAPG